MAKKITAEETERKRKELAYGSFLDAISYRLTQLSEHLNQKYLPKALRQEYQEKLDKLLDIRDTFF